MSKTTIMLENKLQSGEEHCNTVIPKTSVIGCRSWEQLILVRYTKGSLALTSG